jgi:hypothetical protein
MMFKKWEVKIKKYFRHLVLNWNVAGRSLIMCLFHFIHGIIPVKITEHEFWGFNDLYRKEE